MAFSFGEGELYIFYDLLEGLSLLFYQYSLIFAKCKISNDYQPPSHLPLPNPQAHSSNSYPYLLPTPQPSLISLIP